jgi:uncharacterized membrane protein
MNWVPWVLLLHVLGAIIAFGPVFAFPFIGAFGAKEPAHSAYTLRLSAMLSDRIVVPLALLQGVTGLVLILLIGADLTQPTYRWLLSAIVLYLIAISFALGVQRRNSHHLIELVMAPRPENAPPGPPPGAPALIRAIQRGGMLLASLIFVIVILMVVKPGF